jgi:hypothetical protein
MLSTPKKYGRGVASLNHGEFVEHEEVEPAVGQVGNGTSRSLNDDVICLVRRVVNGG